MEELTDFPSTAKWRVLTARQEPVPEPQMGGQLRAPTVPEGEVSIPKFDFDETFDHEPFTELSEVFKSENGKLCKDRRGRQIMESVVRNEGRANAAWMKKKNLTMFSSAKKWIEAFLPDKRKPTDSKHVLTVADWCNFSNTKAILANAGKKGGVYPEFEPFSPAENQTMHWSLFAPWAMPVTTSQNEVQGTTSRSS